MRGKREMEGSERIDEQSEGGRHGGRDGNGVTRGERTLGATSENGQGSGRERREKGTLKEDREEGGRVERQSEVRGK